MAKTKIDKYIPSDDDIKHMSFCIKNDCAIVIQKIHNTNYYWVAKYKPSKYKDVEFLRIDKTKDGTEKNREIFSEYEAQKKCFELYKMIYDKNNKQNTCL